MKHRALWPLCVLLASVLPAQGAAEPPLAPLAHSAALTLEGAAIPGGLIVRVVPAAAGSTAPVTELTATLDGKEAPATLRPDGSWRIALPGHDAAAARRLEVTVTHDGIRELLSASVPQAAAAAPPPEGGGTGLHNQLLWWVLNIAIVLIAALAISRRSS